MSLKISNIQNFETKYYFRDILFPEIDFSIPMVHDLSKNIIMNKIENHYMYSILELNKIFYYQKWLNS